MPDFTYTSKGTFDHNGNVSLNICIPAEPSKGAYKTELYNLSKITASGSVNVILCHFSNGTSVGLQHNSFDYQMNFEANSLSSHSGAVDFDESKEDVLFLFFHDELFQRSDREYFFQNIDLIVDLIRQNGNLNVTIPFNSNIVVKTPRKLGISLVTKRVI